MNGGYLFAVTLLYSQFNTFGVNMILRKRELQTIWSSLLPPTTTMPRNAHVWWEMRESLDDELDALRRNGPSVAW